MSNYQGNIIRKNPATPTGPSTYGSASGMWSLNEVAYWIKQGVWPNPAIVPDIYFPYVSLLLSTTSLGNANNNLFVDSSGAFNPMSRNGNTTQGSFTPYSTNLSNYFAGAGSYLQTPANSATTIVGTLSSTANLTIECWIFPTAYNSSANFPGLIGDMVATSENNNWSWGITNTGTLMLYWNISGTQYRAYTTSTVSLNAWTHIALNVAAGAITMYINGVSQSLTGTTTLGTPSGSNNYLVIGQWNNGSGGTGGTSNGLYTGYISNLRVVKASTYTSNFTVPTAPLSAITSTSLLTCQSNRFRDASTNNLTLTVAGSMAVNDFGPFSPPVGTGYVYNQSDITNWSGYFDGSGDYISAGSNAAFAFGTGAYTTEAWVYITGSNSLNNLFCNDTTNGFDLYFNYSNSTTRLEFRGGSNIIAFSGVPTRGTWTHVALVREGTGTNQTKLYFNGVLQGTGTDATNWTVNGPMLIGALASAGADLSGYISNARIVKGTAVYTATFTPPTSPLTAISGTSLLTLQNAAFTDNSTNNFVITPNGNVTVNGNNPFQVGYYSNYITPGNFLVTPSNAKFQFGTGDFTVEAWVNLTAYDASYSNVYSSSRNEVDSGGVALLISSTGALRIFSYVSNAYVATGGTVPLNQWVHVAMARQGTTLRLFLNGALSASASNSQDFLGFAEGGGIGGWGGANAGSFTGYISNVRIVKGTAVYTAAFTPPTSPLTVISGTSLLACAARAYYIDLSNNFSVGVVSAVPPTNAYNPFYTATIASNGGSMYFDGSGDYLRGANSPAFSFGTGNFTVEMWVYFMDTGGTNKPLFDNGATSNTGRLLIRQGNDAGTANVVNAFVSGTVVGSPAIQFYSWTHVAVVRNSGTVTIYINGVGGTGVSATADLTQNACLLGAFYDVLTNNFTGYMSNVRVTKGTAVYTSNFTPPTAPLTPSANTTLLVNGMNAGIYDATAINDMETAGNAQVSTVQSKFGGSSVYFDGNGDWLDIPANPSLDFGTGDFTIEGWIYVPDRTLNSAICQFGNAATTAGFQFMVNGDAGSGGVIALRTNSGQPLTTTGTISNNTWTHVAITRASGTTRIFINGTTSGGTYNWTSSLSSGSTRRIGGDIYSHLLTGYIDDFRVTRGVARYTSNFTPPTQAFPVY